MRQNGNIVAFFPELEDLLSSIKEGDELWFDYMLRTLSIPRLTVDVSHFLPDFEGLQGVTDSHALFCNVVDTLFRALTPFEFELLGLSTGKVLKPAAELNKDLGFDGDDTKERREFTILVYRLVRKVSGH